MLPQQDNIAIKSLRAIGHWWRNGQPKAETTTALPRVRSDLHTLWQQERSQLPAFVQESTAALKYLDLLGPLDWPRFPERVEKGRAWPGPKPAPRAPFVASYLVKIDKGLKSMPKLHEYLGEQPALVWLLGFPLAPSSAFSWGFDVAQSLPSVKHLGRVLRELDNAKCQFLLQGTVHLLQNELADVLPEGGRLGDEISLDTKHIIAWVVENNPKVRMADRYVKTNQPQGDPDCKLGFKENGNQRKGKGKKATADADEASAEPNGVDVPEPETVVKTHDGSDSTPTQEGMPASKSRVGTFYWGYGSGVVATKVADWAEVVLAEMTQTFDHSDVSYFFPLMSQTVAHLGYSPRSGALDAALDAFYVYEYFAKVGGFAAVPLRDTRNAIQFNDEGTPLCAADIPFALRYSYNKRKGALFPHRRQRYGCPLLFPAPTGAVCPIDDPHWPKNGCTADVAQSEGARIRQRLDRASDEFKNLYKQRTATERINSQALDLGIERPKLRNKHSVSNQNTLIYVLINLRALQRIQEKKANMTHNA